MKATITSKGQITIPAAIRQRLGLKAGDVVQFDPVAAISKPLPAIDKEKARALLGCAREELKGKTAEEWIEWLRGPVELPHDSRRR